MEPGLEEMKKSNQCLNNLVWVAIFFIVGFSVMGLVGKSQYDQGYKQGQLDALQNKYTYLMVDGKILKVIGEVKK